jgi:hypothetical protein
MRFVSEPIEPEAGSFDTAAMGRGEPSLPPWFVWRDERIVVATLNRTWRSTKVDRGDTYLARHWFEFTTAGGCAAIVYFDRHARRGATRWTLYSLSDSPGDPELATQAVPDGGG